MRGHKKDSAGDAALDLGTLEVTLKRTEGWGLRSQQQGRGGRQVWGRAAQGGDRTGSQKLQRAGPVRRELGRGAGVAGGEAGGGAHPQGRQVDVVQAAGGGWVAHGRRRAAHAPARSLRCRRRRFSPIGVPGGRAPPRLPQRPGRGRASGRTDPAADRRSRPRACNPSRRQPCARAERTVTRARRAPPPARLRHLRAGARERAAGARQAEPRGSPEWKERAHPLVRVRTTFPSFSPFYYYYYYFLPPLP